MRPDNTGPSTAPVALIYVVSASMFLFLTPACHAVARQSVGGTPETWSSFFYFEVMYSYNSFHS